MESFSDLWRDIAWFSATYSPLDFVLILENWALFLRGLLNTVALVSLTLLIGGLFAVPVSIIRARRIPVANALAFGYIYFFRGTPMLVQLYLVYYGLSQFEAVRESIFWVVLREAWWCALITMTLCTTAYTAEIFRGALESVPKGEVEAAKAAGLSPARAMYRIIFPSALRRAIPAYSNEVIFVLHASVIASTITIIDILGAGQLLNNRHYTAFEGFIGAAVLYVILTWFITKGFRFWEKKWLGHLREREAPEAPRQQL